MNSLTFKLIFCVFVITAYVQSSDEEKSPLSESSGSEGLTYSLVSFPCTPKKDINSEYNLTITPRATRSVLKVGCPEELAAYEASRNERLAHRLKHEGALRQKQALRLASNLDSPYSHYSAEEMNILRKAKEESLARQAREDRQALGYCGCCALGLILLSGDVMNDSTSISCIPTPSKHKMA